MEYTYVKLATESLSLLHTHIHTRNRTFMHTHTHTHIHMRTNTTLPSSCRFTPATPHPHLHPHSHPHFHPRPPIHIHSLTSLAGSSKFTPAIPHAHTLSFPLAHTHALTRFDFVHLSHFRAVSLTLLPPPPVQQHCNTRSTLGGPHRYVGCQKFLILVYIFLLERDL